MTENDCPFCRPDPSIVLDENRYALLIEDAHPLTDGHSLVVPKRHIVSIFNANSHEEKAIWRMIKTGRQIMTSRQQALAFNIGFNEGADAGQTIEHAHIHLIPRHVGDVKDPRGGIRWIFGERANYWDVG